MIGSEFDEIVERHRHELHAHCYRMLASVHDADDAVQETLIRAWRGVDALREQAAVRPWLYRIATNVCLTELDRRRRRGLPHDFGPPSPGSTRPGRPAADSHWLEPYPDAALDSATSSPESRYEQLESVELAFVAAAQHLGANQRAALLLRDVLGFSAQETADVLGTSVTSANSVLQRARAAIAERTPQRSQQATLRAIDESTVRDCIDRWVDAWQRNDVAAFAALLAADSTFAMPPLAVWYSGRDDVAEWARRYSINGWWRWRAIPTRANGQQALAFYCWDEQAAAYLPFALNVLTFDAHARVSDVTAFIVRAPDFDDTDTHIRFPDRPVLAGLGSVFPRFGLPTRLDDAEPT